MNKNYTKSSIRICETCDGAGLTYIETEQPRHGSDAGSGYYQPCQTCKGLCIVKVTKSVIVTIEPYLLKINQHQHD